MRLSSALLITANAGSNLNICQQQPGSIKDCTYTCWSTKHLSRINKEVTKRPTLSCGWKKASGKTGFMVWSYQTNYNAYILVHSGRRSRGNAHQTARCMSGTLNVSWGGSWAGAVLRWPFSPSSAATHIPSSNGVFESLWRAAVS